MLWTAITLKHLIHCRAKKEKTANKKETQKTGGGLPPPTLPKETTDVLSIIGTEADDLGRDFDSDATRGKLQFLPISSPCYGT